MLTAVVRVDKNVRLKSALTESTWDLPSHASDKRECVGSGEVLGWTETGTYKPTTIKGREMEDEAEYVEVRVI